MQYTDLLKQYKNALHQACRNYEILFTSKRQPVPSHRAQDIFNLEELWEQEDGGPKKIRASTEGLCRKFYTGWFGRSKLRDNIMAVLKSPQYSDDNFYYALLEENQQLQAQQSLLVPAAADTGASAPTADGTIGLQTRIDTLLQEKRQLQEEKTQLNQEINRLNLRIDGLQRANQKLAAQMEDIRAQQRGAGPKALGAGSPGVMSESGLRTLLGRPY